VCSDDGGQTSLACVRDQQKELKSLICIVAPTLVVQGGLPSGYGRIRMGTDVTVSEPVAVRHRSRRTKLKKKIDATQPGRRVRTY